MNHALLAELQRRRIYPSITVLMNTTPGVVMDRAAVAVARSLIAEVDDRLRGDVSDEVRADLVARLADLVAHQEDVAGSEAVAWCVSPEYSAAVRLGRTVDERVVIDETFATRDLVADLNRTAQFRLITVSERMTRTFIGDRARLVEELDAPWPMVRAEDEPLAVWMRDVVAELRRLDADQALPTVIAGVDRTIRRSLVSEIFDPIGFIAGNNDRTSWSVLHDAAWPIVTEWLQTDRADAMAALGRARSSRTYAGGIDEIWPLATQGRIETLVVEDGYAVAARLRDGQVVPTADREAPDVVDDIVDEAIEAVLGARGSVVIVPDGGLDDHGRIAAVLRY